MSKRGLIVSVTVALVLGAGAAAVALLAPGGAEAGGGAATSPPATATVERGDLTDTLTVSGVLGHGAEQPVINSAGGTLTALPAEGAVIGRGDELYEVDRDPVVLMYGPKPMHRTLELGVTDGADVRHLEKNLKALGHDLTVDDHFGLATLTAVREWQADTGLPVTGSVSKSQVVFLPGKVRVQALRASVAAPVRKGQTLLTVTGVERMVTVQLDAGRQRLAKKGAPVGLQLPGELELTGKIAKVGTVAKPAGDDGTSTVEVRITLDDPGKAGTLDQAPVSVELQSEIRRGVLSVPVEALLALREGGYGVEVVEGSSVRVVPVKAGVFAGGRVEVSGGDLREGMRVGVPGT
ncbi:peptidoglycan-binding protein [Nonomuraea turkmeniaca]|uniref:peptidoglycan-binding protein n=1 Tax=Nonomuraea turkmeniaca TaxID=103838 RepID=UPI001FEC2611|nr:peptidoglycan-binding protein [Nonomuraea turkmeniaca]